MPSLVGMAFGLSRARPESFRSIDFIALQSSLGEEESAERCLGIGRCSM